MALGDFIDEVESRRKSITVYSASEPEWIADQFVTRNVVVDYRPLPPDASVGFAIVRDDDGFVASVGLPVLETLLEPPFRRPWEERTSYDELFEVLADTLFTAYDRRQLLATAREIEDRAFRVGSGTLRVGFQRPDALSAQERVYELLAAETALDVHVYVRADWEVSDVPGVTVHVESAGEIGEFWFLAFDGGDDETNACALLAEERRPGQYYGFWTYDPALVVRLLSYLRAGYG